MQSKQKKKKRNLLVGGLIVACLLIGGLLWLNRDTLSRASVPKADESSEVAPQPKEVNKINLDPAQDSDKIQPSSKDEIANGNESSEQASAASLNITQAVQQEQTVFIRGIINGMNGGTCTLTLTKGSLSFVRTAPVGVQSSYATCQGFNIPATDFAESGEWTVNVKADQSGKTAEAQSKVQVVR